MNSIIENKVRATLSLSPMEHHQDYDGTKAENLQRFQDQILEVCNPDEINFLLDFYDSMKKHKDALNMGIATRVNNFEKAIYLMTDERFKHEEGKPYKQWTERDVENFMYKLSDACKSNGRPFSMGYKNKLKLVLKYLITFALHGNDWYKIQMDKDYDKHVKLLKWKTPSGERKIKSKSDLLTEKELYDIFDRVGFLNHQAYFEMVYQSGARPREISKLRVKDITILRQKDTFEVRIYNTKTASGTRVVPFIAPKYVRTWLSYHQRIHDPEAFLFPKRLSGNLFDYNKTYSSNTYTNLLKKSAVRCGISKPVGVYLLRKCNTTHLYQKGMKPEEIKKRNGWVMHSKEFDATYNHIFDEDVEKSYFKAMNVEPEPTNKLPEMTPELFSEFVQYIQNRGS